MRYKSKTVDNFCIYAVAGVNSVSFGIDFKKANTTGLLGFSVKRTYPNNEEHFMPGFKVFQKDEKKFEARKQVSTETEPIQSFVWDDFTLKPATKYTYTFYPVTGKPSALVKGNPIIINIKTESSFSENEHDIFFNRGVASSQAYAIEFNNTSPDKLVGKKQQDAFNWLGRDLPAAINKFISQAEKGETLLGCFYEFNYLPVLKAFKAAIDKGVTVHLIIDAKNNTHKVKEKMVPSTPRVDNLKSLENAGIPKANVIYREANKDEIQHNKFIVYIPKTSNDPTEVWTGSVNITESGIFGQTNVGHWIRNKDIAIKYRNYWQLLSGDPGAKDNDPAAKKKTDKKSYITKVMKLQVDIPGDIPVGITPIFSPRDSIAMLTRYFELIDKATQSSMITLAFGITDDLKQLVLKHNKDSAITFILLEKADKANPKSKKNFYALNSKNNVYEAYGSYIADPLYRWVAETNATKWKITHYVTYIHSKFLLQDPLGNDPIVITGSANFSPPSTIGNDENMVIIRGNQRVADIYFTEFNRLFYHYYYRSILDILHKKKVKDSKNFYFLDATSGWLTNYKEGSLHFKRVEMFVQMKNAETL
jgi:phosphatidylserine/phosphatidylglycerophosphate/cardiolipin synthase-like enzyme